jgi:signal transduction histidine kinase
MGQCLLLSRLSVPECCRKLAWLFIVLLIPGSVFTQQPAGNTTGNDQSDLLYKHAMEVRFTDSTRATELAIKMLQLATEQVIASDQADAHYALATIAYDYNNHNEAIKQFEKSYHFYMLAGDPHGVMKCFYWIARCYRRIADYPKYKQYLSYLEKVAMHLNNREYLSYAYEGYGNLYRYVADYPQSINYYLKAIDLSAKLGNAVDVSTALNNLSLVYAYQDQQEDALKIQLRNYEILQRIDEKSSLVLCLSNLSTSYQLLEQPTEARRYLNEALQLIRQAEPGEIHFKDEASTYSQSASLALDSGDYETALYFYHLELDLRQRNKDVKSVASCYGSLGYVYESMGELSLARDYYTRQLGMAKEIGYVNGQINASESLSGLYAKERNYELAYSYQNVYTTLKDSVEKESSSEMMGQLSDWRNMKDQQHEIEILSMNQQIQDVKLKKQNTIVSALVIGLLIVTVFMIILLRNYLRMKKAEADLQFANKELESFSYSVSHDLRAPLRAIDGFTKIFRQDYGAALDKEGNRLLDIVQANTHKMSHLIDDLLTFSRMGKNHLQSTDLDMKALAEKVADELRSTIKPGTQLNIGNLHPAKGDHNMMFQVWVNLLSNAIKYSSKAEVPHIEISSIHNDRHVIYSIRDNGAGFDMKHAQKLFGVFQRMHSSEEFEGTGVGLATVHRIITRHKGTITAQAELNKGATFSFSLPA